MLRRSSSLRQGLPNVGVSVGRRKSSLEEIGISHFTTLMQATNHSNPIKISLNGSIGLEVCCLVYKQIQSPFCQFEIRRIIYCWWILMFFFIHAVCTKCIYLNYQQNSIFHPVLFVIAKFCFLNYKRWLSHSKNNNWWIASNTCVCVSYRITCLIHWYKYHKYAKMDYIGLCVRYHVTFIHRKINVCV